MKFSFQIASREFSFSLTPSPARLAPQASRSVDPATWLRSDDHEPNRGAILHSPYSQSAWVYIAITALAETVAQIPFRIARIPNTSSSSSSSSSSSTTPLLHHSITPSLRRSLGEHLLEHGPVVDLFNHPHPTMSRTLFWEMLITWYCLRGEFFILPLDESDQPVHLTPHSSSSFSSSSSSLSSVKSPIRRLITLPPDQFWHIVQGYELAGWRFTGSPLSSPISSQVLLPEEIIHSRSPNPYLYWRGLSPLLLALLPASADYAAEQFMKGLMLNNADTGVIVTTDQQVSPDQRQQIMAALCERKRQAGTADRPLFLWSGAKIEKPAASSADLQFLEHRKLNRQEIAAIFKVPESLMGFTDQKNALGGGSSIEQERLTFIENTITSHCRRLEAALAPIISSFGRGLVGYFDLDTLPTMQQARRARFDTAVKALSLGIPFNEINTLLDLGLQATPWGNTGYLPATLQPAGSLPPPPSKAAQPTPPAAELPEQFARILSWYRQQGSAEESPDKLARLVDLLSNCQLPKP